MAFAEGFGARYSTAEGFRASCRARHGGRELKRATDVCARVPFAGYNLRIYRQTYYGIRDVLAPLVVDERVAVVPMMAPQPDKALVMEVCPASALKRLALYRSYKGRSTSHCEARAAVLDNLLAQPDLALTNGTLRGVMIADPEGDALDSFIAAAITFWAIQVPDRLITGDAVALLEGRVFY